MLAGNLCLCLHIRGQIVDKSSHLSFKWVPLSAFEIFPGESRKAGILSNLLIGKVCIYQMLFYVIIYINESLQRVLQLWLLLLLNYFGSLGGFTLMKKFLDKNVAEKTEISEFIDWLRPFAACSLLLKPSLVTETFGSAIVSSCSSVGILVFKMRDFEISLLHLHQVEFIILSDINFLGYLLKSTRKFLKGNAGTTALKRSFLTPIILEQKNLWLSLSF